MTQIHSPVPPSFRTSIRGLASTLALAAAGCAALAPAARAISMRDDVPNVNSTGTDNPYVAFGASSAFDAIGNLQYSATGSTGISSGSGTLVQSTTPGVYKFLTAAHNVDGNATGTLTATTYNLYFGNSNGGFGGANAATVVTVPAANVAIEPQWYNGSGSTPKAAATYDIAVITFTLAMVTKGTLPSNPLGFSLTSPLGKTGTLVGYGSYGTGNNFVQMGPDGVRRAGQNTIDVVGNYPGASNQGNGVLAVDYDSPRDTSVNVFGSANPLTYEALNAPGDSGGPLLIQDANGQYQIAGVNNGVFANSAGRNFEYGGKGLWGSVMQSENMAYLMSQGVAVPEPSTYALLALSLTALVVFARRRGVAAAH